MGKSTLFYSKKWDRVFTFRKQWNFASGIIEILPFSLLRTVITKTFLLPELCTQCYCEVRVNIFIDQWCILCAWYSVRFAKLYFVNCYWSILYLLIWL
jgi:hypothetical protein